MVAVVAVIAEEVSEPGVPQGGGGVQRKVSPDAGLIRLVVVVVAVLAAPAVVAAQFVVVVRLLKSATAAPRSPTWVVRDSVLDIV
jgi:hypothetical protein